VSSQLQTNKAITRIYKILEVKNVKKQVFMCEMLCASWILVLHMTHHTNMPNK
jgi:hypothetical protein